MGSRNLTPDELATRRADAGDIDLYAAELELASSIYEGFEAAIMVAGEPRMIALCRRYGDAVQLMGMIDAARATLPQNKEWEADGR
ncbi:hypothetical protein [Phenylobacterium sp.]|uniref:hypothetical protein n=1 Tax=Phenylobacterium sp. TaxID=1871053 RepID=UPI0019872009|nr:hypothetical protein [Phenylobacterium sp.]MBC7168763.1 hypothetical protein [Phenylobacterium sp.]